MDRLSAIFKIMISARRSEEKNIITLQPVAELRDLHMSLYILLIQILLNSTLLLKSIKSNQTTNMYKIDLTKILHIAVIKEFGKRLVHTVILLCKYF